MSEIKVGQVAYFHSYHTRKVESVEITKVGRKWLYFGRVYSVSINSLTVYRGEDECGHLWLTMDAYNALKERDAIWGKLRDGLGYTPPDSISTEDLRAAAKLLGLIKEGGK